MKTNVDEPIISQAEELVPLLAQLGGGMWAELPTIKTNASVFRLNPNATIEELADNNQWKTVREMIAAISPKTTSVDLYQHPPLQVKTITVIGDGCDDVAAKMTFCVEDGHLEIRLTRKEQMPAKTSGWVNWKCAECQACNGVKFEHSSSFDMSAGQHLRCYKCNGHIAVGIHTPPPMPQDQASSS